MGQRGRPLVCSSVPWGEMVAEVVSQEENSNWMFLSLLRVLTLDVLRSWGFGNLWSGDGSFCNLVGGSWEQNTESLCQCLTVCFLKKNSGDNYYKIFQGLSVKLSFDHFQVTIPILTYLSSIMCVWIFQAEFLIKWHNCCNLVQKD